MLKAFQSEKYRRTNSHVLRLLHSCLNFGIFSIGLILSNPHFVTTTLEIVEKPSKRHFEPYFCVLSICFYYVRFFQKCDYWSFPTVSNAIATKFELSSSKHMASCMHFGVFQETTRYWGGRQKPDEPKRSSNPTHMAWFPAA